MYNKLRKSSGFIQTSPRQSALFKVGRGSSENGSKMLYWKKGKSFFGIASITATGELLSETASRIMDKCERIEIRNSQITIIDEDFFLNQNLAQLQTLQLQNNKLTTLPNSTLHLQFLKIVDLTNNKIQCFPTYLKELPKLKQLILSKNQIIIIPECINEFPSLTKLELNNNLVHILPTILKDNQTLKKISLRNNPVMCPPLYL